MFVFSKKIVISDGNFPAVSCAKDCELVRLDGHGKIFFLKEKKKKKQNEIKQNKTNQINRSTGIIKSNLKILSSRSIC